MDDFSDKIESALGMDHLNSLEIIGLHCSSTVANEFLDLLCGYDLPEQGLAKLTLARFRKGCDPFEDEVLTRLANMCPHISNFQMSSMGDLTEEGKLSMVNLLR